MKEENRKIYIDIIRAIGIILVVLGHSIENVNEVKSFIYSFHMPLFFVIFGMLMTSKEKNILKYTIKKFCQLIIPYIIFALIYAGFSKNTIPYILYGTRLSLVKADSLSSLWFLVAYFISAVISQIIINFTKKFKHNIIVINIIMSITSLIGYMLSKYIHLKYNIPLELDVALFMMLYIMIGFNIKNMIEKLVNKNFKNKKIVLLFASIVLYSLCFYFNKLNKVDYVLFGDAAYGNVSFIFASIFGIFATIFLSIFICIAFNKKILNYIKFIGANTLGILVLHKIIIYFCNVFTTKINNDLLSYTINFIFALSISTALTYLINKYVPNLLGKNIYIDKKS